MLPPLELATGVTATRNPTGFEDTSQVPNRAAKEVFMREQYKTRP